MGVGGGTNLVVAQRVELFLFHDLHQRLLNGFPNQHLENRYHLRVKVEKLLKVQHGPGQLTESMGKYDQIHTLTSPGRICVVASIPVLGGTKSGEGGRSRKASVWTSTSVSSTLSVSSSRYSSVCTSMCLRPSTASGVLGRSFSATRARACALR